VSGSSNDEKIAREEKSIWRQAGQ